MSSAAITAYMAGAQLASETIRLVEAGVELDDLPDQGFGSDLLVARIRLGDVHFSYWMLRGSTEAVEAMGRE